MQWIQSNLVYVGAAAVVCGTIGGVIEGKAAPGSKLYRVGAFLASLGVDLASLGKMFGGGAS